MPISTPEASCQEKVLVLGDDSRNVLPIVRSLGRRAITVDVGWCAPGDPLLRSRYLNRFVPLPDRGARYFIWIDSLRRLLRQEKYNLVIPATEGAVFALQTHRDALETLAPVYLLDQDVFETVIDKSRTYELAKAANVLVPEGATVDRVDQLDALRGAFSLPAVVKPCSSIRRHGLPGKNFVRTVDTWDELRMYARRLMERGSGVILQQWVPGRGEGVELLAFRGAVCFAFQHVRLHETGGYGSTYRASCPVRPELLEAAQRLLKLLHYTGVAMIEFRVDPATGRWVLLEINGRFWGSLPLSVAAGADFPWYLYQLLVHGRRDFPAAYRVGVRSRHLTHDARWLWRTIRRKRTSACSQNDDSLGWAVNSVKPWQVACHTLRGLAGMDHADTFAWDDPGPAFAEGMALLKAAVGPRPLRAADRLAGAPS